MGAGIQSPVPRSLRISSWTPRRITLTHSLQILLLLALVIAAAKIAGALACTHSSAGSIRRNPRRRRVGSDRLERARRGRCCSAARVGQPR